MENKEAKSIVRRYKIERIVAVFFIYAFVLIVNILTNFNIGGYILALLISLIVSTRIFSFIRKYNFACIIDNNLDAKLFSEIANYFHKNSKTSVLWNIESSFYSGDYKNSSRICSESMKSDKRILYQKIYLFMLAEIYFELGEKEKLKYTCKKIDLLVSDKNTFKQKFFGFLKFIFLGINENKTLKMLSAKRKFFESYLKGDFEECLTTLNKYKCKTNCQKVNKDLSLAIIYYRSGDMTQSKILFEEIIQKAPKMNFAKISQKYLEAIENSAGIDVSFSDMLQPQSDEL